jgi:Restriction endonuclease
MRARATRTLNPLPFRELEPGRFEDLCLALLYSIRPWSDIRHYGRSGTDGGVDIAAWESLEDGSRRTWLVQCRRYSKASKSVLVQATNDALARTSTPPDVLLVVVPCDVSRTAHEAYEEYAHGRNVTTPLVWSRSVLEAKLHAERRDLLFSFFDIPMATESRSREATISRNIAMKRRVTRELIDPSVKYHEVAETPWARFRHGRMIIRSVDDSAYPRVDAEAPGISSWFRLDVFDLYFNGIAFQLGLADVVLNSRESNYKWALLPPHIESVPDSVEAVRAWHLGRIPYRNIVELDNDGDEYYPMPHLYCRFAEGGEPYEEHSYVLANGFPYPLDAWRQCTLAELLANVPAG